MSLNNARNSNEEKNNFTQNLIKKKKVASFPKKFLGLLDFQSFKFGNLLQ